MSSCKNFLFLTTTVLLLMSFGVLPRFAEATETTATVWDKGGYSPGNLQTSDEQIITWKVDTYADIATPFRLNMEMQKKCGQNQTKSVSLDTVAQVFGTRCLTPAGWCWLINLLPLNTMCCCYFPTGHVCGYVIR